MALLNKYYTDIKYGFERNSGGDISPVFNESSINQSLITLFLTKRGERFFNPRYGTNIPTLLFEPLDTNTAKQITTEIQDTVDFYEGSRIELININMVVDYDNNYYKVSVEYRIKSTTETATLNLTLPRG